MKGTKKLAQQTEYLIFEILKLFSFHSFLSFVSFSCLEIHNFNLQIKMKNLIIYNTDGRRKIALLHHTLKVIGTVT